MDTIELNDQLPEFVAHDSQGNAITQTDFEGYPTLLYFFPKFNSPVWMVLLSKLKENMAYFVDYDVKIGVVFAMEAAEIQDFEKRVKVPFYLIADPQAELFKLFNFVDEQQKPQNGCLILDDDATIRLIDKSLVQMKDIDKIIQNLTDTCCS